MEYNITLYPSDNNRYIEITIGIGNKYMVACYNIKSGRLTTNNGNLELINFLNNIYGL